MKFDEHDDVRRPPLMFRPRRLGVQHSRLRRARPGAIIPPAVAGMASTRARRALRIAGFPPARCAPTPSCPAQFHRTGAGARTPPVFEKRWQPALVRTPYPTLMPGSHTWEAMTTLPAPTAEFAGTGRPSHAIRRSYAVPKYAKSTSPEISDRKSNSGTAIAFDATIARRVPNSTTGMSRLPSPTSDGCAAVEPTATGRRHEERI